MLTFRNTNILFIGILCLLIGFHIYYGMPLFVYPLLIFVYSLILFYGSYYVGSGFFVKIICSASTAAKVIAISFDDGPAVNYTPQLLQLLKENEIEAVFFCIGNRIKGNEHILQQIDAGGHVIGNHSYSHHTWFDLFTSKKMKTELTMTDDAINKVIHQRPRLFRPPYGVTTPNLKKAITAGNYIPVGWSVRSYDTVIKDEKKLLDRICKGIQPGAIFLFHDTSHTTLLILSAFIKEVKFRGYTFIRLDKMLNLPSYA